MSSSLSYTANHCEAKLQVEPLEERCVLSSAGFVNGLYHDILHRTPAPTEVTAWVNTLNAVASPGEIAFAFATSVEYESNLIRSDYELFLKRQPSSMEINGWLAQLQAGLPQDKLQAAFLASDEFFSRHGGSIAPWLGGVYHDVLGRAPDPAGLAVWSQTAQSGVPRTAVALSIVDSPEADARLVSAVYRDLLKRNPDPVGLVTWVSAVERGLLPSELLTMIASSDEYIQLTAQGVLDVPLNPIPFVFAEPVFVDVSVPVVVFVPDPFFIDPVVADPFLFDFGGFDSAFFDDGGECGCDF